MRVRRIIAGNVEVTGDGKVGTGVSEGKKR